jgi:hypothetical protein
MGEVEKNRYDRNRIGLKRKPPPAGIEQRRQGAFVVEKEAGYVETAI